MNASNSQAMPAAADPPSHRAAPTATSVAPAESSLLLTLDEVAAELRCARRSVERRIAADDLRTVRFGRCVRVERVELARFIAGHTERSSHAELVGRAASA